MTRELAETIVKACRVFGMDDTGIYDQYSGRGMYGDTTVGVVLDGRIVDLVSAVIEHAELFMHETYPESRFEELQISMDNMGNGIIIY